MPTCLNKHLAPSHKQQTYHNSPKPSAFSSASISRCCSVPLLLYAGSSRWLKQVWAVGNRLSSAPLREMTNGGLKCAKPLMGTRSDPVMKNSRRFCCASSRSCTVCGTGVRYTRQYRQHSSGSTEQCKSCQKSPIERKAAVRGQQTTSMGCGVYAARRPGPLRTPYQLPLQRCLYKPAVGLGCCFVHKGPAVKHVTMTRMSLLLTSRAIQKL